MMIVNIKKSKNVLKIKYKSNGKKHCEKITADKEFNIDENSYFKIIKYDTDFDSKENKTYTLRNRDTMEQTRMTLDEIIDFVKKQIKL